MSLLILRADADATIGGGHFMRLLAIGQWWRGAGRPVATASHDPPEWLVKRASALGPVIRLPARWPDRRDADGVVEVAAGSKAGSGQAAVCADGYHFDQGFQERIRAAGFPILLVDDIADRNPYSPDILLNQNVDAENLSYVISDSTLALLGPKYALIRDEFFDVERRSDHPEVARRLLVTMGASDPLNVTTDTVAAIADTGLDCELTVVVGGSFAGHGHLDTLVESGTGDVKVRVVRNPSLIAPLMAEAEMAITGGGSTCWETAYLGLPSLIRVFVDNQTGIAHGLDRRGAAQSLGWFGDRPRELMTEAIARLAMDRSARRTFADRAMTLVDGQGRGRVCRALQQALDP